MVIRSKQTDHLGNQTEPQTLRERRFTVQTTKNTQNQIKINKINTAINFAGFNSCSNNTIPSV